MARKSRKKAVKPNPEYKLKPSSYSGFCILAVDPGSRNFGISCVGLKGNKPEVLASACLMLPVNTLVDFTQARRNFLHEIGKWVRVFKPKAIIGERFQTRGNGGPLIEFVSVMLGMLAGKYEKLPIRLITASTWKNKFNRRFGVDLKELYPTLSITPHAFDASLIGVYGLEFGFKRDLDYTPQYLIRQATQASLMPEKPAKKVPRRKTK